MLFRSPTAPETGYGYIEAAETLAPTSGTVDGSAPIGSPVPIRRFVEKPDRATAEAFLATLSGPQRAKAVFAYQDEAQRKNWSNLPTPMYQRAGIRWGALISGCWRSRPTARGGPAAG